MLNDFEPIEDVKSLFAGRILPERAQLDVTGENLAYRVEPFGEFLLEGAIDGGDFLLTRIKRIALSGKTIRDNSDQSDPFNTFSLVGPLDLQDGNSMIDNPLTQLRFQLHYQELSRIGFEQGLNAGNEHHDAVFPPTVQMIGTLNWFLTVITETRIRFECNLGLEDEVEFNQANGLQNLASSISLSASIELSLVGAAPFASDVEPPTALFAVGAALVDTPCATPATPCSPTAQVLGVRRILLRLVDLSQPPGAETPLVTLCNQQVADACHVWRSQAILDLRVVSQILDATAQNHIYGIFDPQLWSNLVNDRTLHAADCVNIYIVDTVLDEFGIQLGSGGLALDAHVASASIFLERSKLGSNQYLLAHELGHVLGLGHPNEVTILNDNTVLPEGAVNSVLHPPTFGGGNNHQQNCLIFGNSLLNPLALIVEPSVQDCLRLP